MIKANFQERRDSIRIKRLVTVRHRLSKRGGKKREDIWQLSVTEDMSYSGLLFSSALPYKIDDVLELQVMMSGALYLFNGYGKVVRVSTQKNGYFHIGIKYIDLKSRNKASRMLTDTNQKSSQRKVSRSAKKI